MEPDELELLRWHIEAGWGAAMPELTPGDVEVPVAQGATPWDLYLARGAIGEVRVWRDVPASERGALLQRAVDAFARAEDGVGVPGVKGEVVLRRQRGVPPPDGRARRLGADDRDLLEGFEPGESAYWLDPRRAPLRGVVEGGRLLSVAHSSRRTARACELGINTLAEARRRGFARACVLAWARAVEEEGLEPLYSADWSNAPSLALARACGYRPYARGAQVSRAAPNAAGTG